MEQPIGIFDSGIGGISIATEINQLLPNENIIYFADSKNAPYGNKTKKQIQQLAHKNTEKLISTYNAKLIVVACNTATTNAIKELRNNYNIPFIGIEPAIKPAALKTRNNKIGILATKGTLASKLFAETTKKFISKEIELVQVEGKNIVEAIEENKHLGKDFTNHLYKQLKPFKDKNIDSLVLGCTHYPFIRNNIQELLPNTHIIDSGFAVARQTRNVIKKNELFNFNQTSSKYIKIYSNSSNLEPIQALTLNRFLIKPTIEYLNF